MRPLVATDRAPPMELPALYLKKNEERRLRAGHLWVYSNEVDTGRSPLSDFQPGQQVALRASDDKVIGVGYINPHSLICARLISRDPDQRLARSLLTHRLKVALALRERLFPRPYYRLVHSEGDQLPGLIVDRFGDLLVAQLNTAGMQAVRDEVVAALDKVLRPSAILLRNDSVLRTLEGLTPEIGTALGTPPAVAELEENEVSFRIPLQDGQKTGWYFDHRQNRRRMQNYVSGLRVLDLFSYLGAWGLQAAAAGAAQVTLVESSASALDWARRNAAEQGVLHRLETFKGDVFELLREFRAARRRFDVVIADPPAFIKRKKDLGTGREAYRRLNRMAMQVLEKDGLLISASCSFHLAPRELNDLLLQQARHLDRSLQLLERGHQGPDHPIHPAIPETDYIKCLFGRVLPA